MHLFLVVSLLLVVRPGAPSCKIGVCFLFFGLKVLAQRLRHPAGPWVTMNVNLVDLARWTPYNGEAIRCV